MNEIAKRQMCLLIRGNLEIWIDEDRADKVKMAMKIDKYVEINGSTIATFDITGILTPEHMEEKTRRANGQYKCSKGNWHDKGQKCECRQTKGLKKGFVEGIGEIEYPDF